MSTEHDGSSAGEYKRIPTCVTTSTSANETADALLREAERATDSLLQPKRDQRQPNRTTPHG